MSKSASEAPRLEGDHRQLGRDMGIYTTADAVGAGLPLWLPNGAVIRRELENYVLGLERRAGYQHVYTPPLAKKELYQRSGHWEHYQDSMFPPMTMGEEEIVLRPMNCPHHILVFQNEGRSYRELPFRVAELGQMFRNELSGAVSGLSRVRAMTLNDGHVFLAEDQIQSEVSMILSLIERAYTQLGLGKVTYRLSLRGPGEKYVPGDDLWDKAESSLRACLDAAGVSYVEGAGEAAFYGPKIDVQVQGHSGGEETISTIQLDFHLPAQFNLRYRGSDGEDHMPVLIHRSIISTMERMTAFLLEKHNGKLPLWLSPVQVAVLPLSDPDEGAAHALFEELLERDLRVRLNSDSPLGARVSAARKARIPYTVVIGPSERESASVAVRVRGDKKPHVMLQEEFLALVTKKVQERSLSLT